VVKEQTCCKMKKNIFVSAGLAALGAAALQSAMADDSASPQYWNVSATLRGFYDDNYNIAGNGRGSAGIEFSPTVSFHVPLQQTDLGIRYTYGLYYYEDRDELGLNPFDQTHQVDLWVDHAFNERWHAKLTDSFAIGQEPELLNNNPALANPVEYRVNGDNLSNHGTFVLDTDWTRLFGTTLTYNNSYYDYDNSGATVASLPATGPTLAGTLNRIEQSVSLDLKWHVQPETTLFIGYQFSWVDYTGNEPIAIVGQTTPTFNGVYYSSDRDSVTHYAYLGLEHQFTANLDGTIKVGGSYIDTYADPLYPSTSLSPYADLSLEYTYIPGSYVQFGFTQDISSTDQVTPNAAGQITQYAQDSVVYADINHKFTPKLTGTVIGRMQYSVFQGGQANNGSEVDYSLGINLNYLINRHFSVDAGYNYDNLVSDVPGYAYSRNRVYLGLMANY
jgi:hypothetical protein